jgi:hypothetical protein
MQVSKVTTESIEVATQTADGGIRILMDDEVQVCMYVFVCVYVGMHVFVYVCT